MWCGKRRSASRFIGQCDIGNKSYAEKKAAFAKSPIIITSEIAKNDNWGSKEIDARQAIIAAAALDIWKL
jgi:hypothetical protein